VYRGAMPRVFTIRDAARASGLAPDTIRYYERAGVLPRPPRSPAGYRQYGHEHVEVLKFARRLREFGLPLATVRELVRLVHDATCGSLREELLDRLREARAEVAVRLRELREMGDRLALLEQELAQLPPGEERLRALTPCRCLRSVDGGSP